VYVSLFQLEFLFTIILLGVGAAVCM